jgi:apolipoprotein N-acyltransferase
MSRLEPSRTTRIALALLAGVLFYFTLNLTPWWPAAWLAPISLLVAAFHAGGREARLLAWLAAAIGVSSNFTYYLKTTGPVAAVVVILLQVL